jgi:L-ribulose-5-phosphate 4-epimerase
MDVKLWNLRQAIVTCSRGALEQNLIRGTDGNFSARDPESRTIAVTPSAVAYDLLEPVHVVVVDVDGVVIEGKLPPTSELKMHLAIYRARDDVQAIIHTHAPFSLVFAAAGIPIRIALTETAHILGNDVPVAPYFKAGSAELADAVCTHLGQGSAVLLERHGLVTVGTTIEGAVQATMAVESAARTNLFARSAGIELKNFSSNELKELHKDYRLHYHPDASNSKDQKDT